MAAEDSKHQPSDPSDSGILYPNPLSKGSVPTASSPDVTRQVGSSANAQPHPSPLSIDANAAVEKLPKVGEVVGPYRLTARQASGPTSVAFSAQHIHLERVVMVTLYHAPISLLGNPTDSLAEWHKRIRALAGLRDETIVPVLDAGEASGIPYFVTEQVQGASLESYVAQRGPLPFNVTLDLIERITIVLRKAHQQGIMHGNLNPQQIWINSSKDIKTRGWSLTNPCLPIDGLDNLTITSLGYDTRFMAPEQFTALPKLPASVDIYALGCLWHWMLTGRAIFEGLPLDVAKAHRDRSPLPISLARADIPSLLSQIWQRIFHKSPEARLTLEELLTHISVLRHATPETSPDVSGGSDSSHLLSQSSSGSTRRLSSSGQSGMEFDPRQVIALDVGCDMIRASVMRNGILTPVELAPGRFEYPAAVYLERDKAVTGWEAITLNRQGTARDIKSSLGQVPSRHEAAMTTPPEVWLAFALRRIHDLVQTQVGFLRRAVLTVPGCFHDLQRKSLTDAAYIASLDTLAIVNESTALALWSAYQQGQFAPAQAYNSAIRHKLVIRLGRGSFEAAVFRFQGHHVTALARGGDSHLGLIAWDQQLSTTLRQVLAPPKSAIGDPQAVQAALLRSAEIARIELCKRTRVKLRGTHAGPDEVFRLTRAVFDVATASLVERMTQQVRLALEKSSLRSQDLNEVILAGGGAHIPSVQQAIRDILPECSLTIDTDPNSASQGALVWAALHQHAFHPGVKIQVDEVNSTDVGVAAGRNSQGAIRYSRIVPANSILPVTRVKMFGSTQTTQESVRVPLVSLNETAFQPIEPLGECQVWYHQLGQHPGSQIRLVFQLNSAGRLSVFAEPLPEGPRQSLDIHRPVGLTADQSLRWRDWLDTAFLCSPT